MQEKEAVRQFFINYLTDAKIKEEIAEKILKLSEVYARTHKQKEFIKIFYDVVVRKFQQKSFVTMGKRFLYIIHQLLERDQKKEKQDRYSGVISQSIVEYYLFFFTNIFKYSSLRDLIIELKMYRMKWAKKITDQSFYSLRDQITKKFKFNLEKGFPQQNLEKIKKLYQKRGFTQEQTNKYLGLNTNQDNIRKISIEKQITKRQNYSSQSQQSDNSKSNNSSSPKKRIKPNENVKVKNNMQQSSPMHTMYSPLDYGKYSNTAQTVGYPPYQIPNSNYGIQNTHPNSYTQTQVFQKRFNGEPFDYRPQQENMRLSQINYVSANMQNGYQSQSTNQNDYNKNKVQNETASMPTSSYIIPNYIFHNPKPTFKEAKQIQLLQKLTKNLISCRECGLLFENSQNYEEHIQKHFFQSLEKFNPQTLPKGNKLKQDRIRLLDIKTWLNTEKASDNELYFQVVMEPEFAQVKTCYFCNETLDLTWSQKCSKWAFRNCVKVLVKIKTEVMHFQCYQGFQNESSSNSCSVENNNKINTTSISLQI